MTPKRRWSVWLSVAGCLLAPPVSAAASAGAAPGPAASAPAEGADWAGMSRGFLRVRPFVGVTSAGFAGEEPVHPAGAIVDLGVEAETRAGFHIGFDLAPMTFLAARPQLTTRLHLGYATEFLSVAMGRAGADHRPR